jgi:hypothetical protein
MALFHLFHSTVLQHKEKNPMKAKFLTVAALLVITSMLAAACVVPTQAPPQEAAPATEAPAAEAPAENWWAQAAQ